MSLKRRVARSMLRAVGPDEAAFRSALATVELCRKLVLGAQVGFLKEEHEEELCPCVVIRGMNRSQEPAAFTYRLNNHRLTGTQAECEKRWRDWLVSVFGDRPADEVSKKIMADTLEKSYLGNRRAARMFTLAVERAGLVIPAHQVHRAESKGESCT